MKTKYEWLGRVAAFAGLFGMLLVAGAARADNYNIIFKSRTAIIPCATGGFSFTKTTAGTFATAGASATLQPGCLTPATLNGTYNPGALSVVVQDINTPEPQGPNVVGLTGTLQYTTTDPGDCGAPSANTAPKTYTITFAYGGSPVATDRRYQITCVGPGTALAPTSGLYHVHNASATVPEPETLWLALAGLSALALSRRRRRRS